MQGGLRQRLLGDDTVDVPIQDWATAIQSDVSSALVAHPDINAVIIAFDGMTQFAMPAVEEPPGPEDLHLGRRPLRSRR